MPTPTINAKLATYTHPIAKLSAEELAKIPKGVPDRLRWAWHYMHHIHVSAKPRTQGA